ncbi:MAG: hypothetical protein WCF23_03190 [Candidatus Nitrosopolaris sp.]
MMSEEEQQSRIGICLWPVYTPGDIMCRTCQQPMSLYSIDRRKPPMFYDCTKSCKRKLFCSEIVDAFIEAQIKVEEELEVSIMAFPMDNKEIRIEIESIEYVGESRNKSTLKILTQYQKNEIQDLLLDYIESILSITVEDFSDLWQS